ncbi:MAG: glutamine--fructose-6-phosphate transaminase (isomerizing) [Pseudomonadota bacterium]
MCGIVGAVMKSDVVPSVVEGLEKLSYRGYDSAGVASLSDKGALTRRRAAGKIESLKSLINRDPITGCAAVGHTRWATHGAPTETNAHPHVAGSIAVVHNGIIENYEALRRELRDRGFVFSSDTDTETVPQLMRAELENGCDPVTAARRALARLEGQHAVCALVEGPEEMLIAAKKDSPLVIGFADDGYFVGSDILAFADKAREAVFLEDEDIAVITRHGVEISGYDGLPRERRAEVIRPGVAVATKGAYRHFMLKEIHEQPAVIAKQIEADAFDAPPSFQSAGVIDIVACGTSANAGLVARDWFARLGGKRIIVDSASEYRYKEKARDGDVAPAVVISQSGETADTLACLRSLKKSGRSVAAIVNVPTSSIAREANAVALTTAGAEIGVASTKAFTAQLTALLRMAMRLGEATDPDAAARAERALGDLPAHMEAALDCEDQIKKVARDIQYASNVMYLGRGAGHGLAVEGALKLKEISYIHAEGFAAGELKHGPIALIEEGTPVVIIAFSGPLLSKTISNLEEVAARGAETIVIGDPAAVEEIGDRCNHAIALPDAPEETLPIIAAAPLQLLAYHVAVLRGTDVDQPRNLAKSVTVE